MRTALLIVAVLVLLAGLALVLRFGLLARVSHERVGRNLSSDAGASPLAACPEKPGCARRELTLTVAPEAARIRLLAAISAERGSRLLTTTPRYVRAEVKTRLFGFLDDVEARFDLASGRLELRSTSRVGVSDLGANAARLDRLVRAITAPE